VFKQLFGMIRQEYSPLSPEEIEVIDNGLDLPEDKRPDHKSALGGSRLFCYTVSLAYADVNPMKAYFWATVALLAGERDAGSWLRSLDRRLLQDQRFYLETIARKWYLAHKDDFEARKREHEKFARKVRGVDPDNW